MKLVQVVLFAVAALLALPAAAQTKSDMQILADKIKADKKLVVAANMQLSEEEAKERGTHASDSRDQSSRTSGGAAPNVTSYTWRSRRSPAASKTSSR